MYPIKSLQKADFIDKEKRLRLDELSRDIDNIESAISLYSDKDPKALKETLLRISHEMRYTLKKAKEST